MKTTTFLTETPVAHRGLHGGARPENSIAAFQAAIDAGYAVETDVHFTKDGKLVVFHDDTLLRMTGDPRAVADCTAEELSSLRLADTQERIPLFSEFLALLKGQVPLLLEIKNMAGVKGKEIAAALAEAFSGYRGEYAIQSFQPFYVKACKKRFPHIACGVLATAKSGKDDLGGSPFWRIKACMIRRMSLNAIVKPDFISYRAEDVPSRPVGRFRGTKLAWTVRSPEEETRVRQYVDNVIFENYLPAR